MLVIDALPCLVVGGLTVFNAPLVLNTGFGIPYNNMHPLSGIIMGLQWVFMGGVGTVSAVWTRRGNISGVTTGIAVALYMISFGVVTFLKLGLTAGLMGDTSRGLVTVIFGVMAYREFKTQQG
jgi:hypothetical protein